MRDGGWVVTADAGGGSVAAYGRTLEKARLNIAATLRTALKSYSGGPVIDDAIAVSAAALNAVEQARQAKDAALKASAASNAATETAARKLEAEGLSLRDIAYVLGISHSRVHQVIGKPTQTKG
jgi:DNA-directed RNA polymerase specialized sigma24 family protein